jgi:hypothetical protein
MSAGVSVAERLNAEKSKKCFEKATEKSVG